jgi:hypothetical protein
MGRPCVLLGKPQRVNVVTFRRAKPELLEIHQSMQEKPIDRREDIPSVLVERVRDPGRRV